MAEVAIVVPEAHIEDLQQGGTAWSSRDNDKYPITSKSFAQDLVLWMLRLLWQRCFYVQRKKVLAV